MDIICWPVMLPIPENTLGDPIKYLGQLFKNKDGVLNIPTNKEDLDKSITWFDNRPQHLYLVSDREIKEDDWYHDTISGGIHKCISRDLALALLRESDVTKRVEAITDKSLNLPLIPQSFIQEWVDKQGKIDKVRIKINYKWGITPVEGKEVFTLYNNDEVIILPIKDSFTEKEMKIGMITAIRAYIDFVLSGDVGEVSDWFLKWFDKNY